MEDFKQILAAHPFFKGLKPEFLQTIARCASAAFYDGGQVIYREGDPADQFFVILEGKVSIEIFSVRRGPLSIQTVGSGDVLGWSWFFPPHRRRFDARAVKPARAVALDGKCLRERAARDHRLGYELLKRFSVVVVDRLAAMTLRVADMYGRHL